MKNNFKVPGFRNYIKVIVPRYKTLTKKEKSALVRSLATDFNRHRGSVVRAFNEEIAILEGRPKQAKASSSKRHSRPGRPEVYGDDVIWWLQTLWVTMGKMSEKLMKEALPHWLKWNFDPKFPLDVKIKILSMSASTMERLLRAYKKDLRKKHFSTTKPAMKGVQARIPLKPMGNKITLPGFLEADTVAHCGSSLMGSFAWSLNTTCHLTTWTEPIAYLGNTKENVVEALKELLLRYPFKIWGFHSDNGTEFLNDLVINFLENHLQIVQTRGRPYKKNDQARIEQKNWTHVRQVFGYERVDTQHLVDFMNDIYSNEHRLLTNFFVPTRKLVSKVRVGSKIVKKYDTPKTPYQRVLEQDCISQIEKEKLTATYLELNPFELRKRLDDKLKTFAKLLTSKNSNSYDVKERKAA